MLLAIGTPAPGFTQLQSTYLNRMLHFLFLACLSLSVVLGTSYYDSSFSIEDDFADFDEEVPFLDFSFGDVISSAKRKIGSVADDIGTSVKKTVKEADKAVKKAVISADKQLDAKLDSLFGIFPTKVSNFLKLHGSKVPTNIVAHRKSLSDIKVSGLKLLSNEKLKPLQEKLKAKGFDSLFHAWLTVTIDGKSYILEKNQIITIIPDGNYPQPFDSKPVSDSFNGMTLSAVYKKAFDMYGRSFPQEYSPFTNNCQHFVVNLLNAGGLNSTPVKSWILSPMELLQPAMISGAGPVMTGVIQAVGLADRAVQKLTRGKISLDYDDQVDGDDEAELFEQDISQVLDEYFDMN